MQRVIRQKFNQVRKLVKNENESKKETNVGCMQKHESGMSDLKLQRIIGSSIILTNSLSSPINSGEDYF